MNLFKTVMPIVAFCCLAVASGEFLCRPLQVAYAEDNWKTEFDDLCSKTDDSPSLAKDEVKNLIVRCDALKPRIEKLEESPRKVYLKRLQACRDLFVFALESGTHD
jgi:hypothetical protein